MPDFELYPKPEKPSPDPGARDGVQPPHEYHAGDDLYAQVASNPRNAPDPAPYAQSPQTQQSSPSHYPYEAAGRPSYQGAPAASEQSSSTAPSSSKPTRKVRFGVAAISGAVVVLVGLLLGGAIYVKHLNNTTYGPQGKVEEYLQALVDGKASKALDLLDINAVTAERPLLSDDVYANASMHPTAFDIDEPVKGADAELSDDEASVTASLTLDSKRYPLEFKLKKSGTTSVFFDNWELTEGFNSGLQIGDIGGATTVNGIEVEFPAIAPDDDRSAITLPALPGSYTFKAPEGTDYLTYGDDVTVLVLPGSIIEQDDGAFVPAGEADPVQFSQSWTKKAGEDAIAQVKQRIGECMKSNKFKPVGCENSLEMYEPFEAITQIKRSWSEEPRYTFDDGTDEEGYFGASEPSVVISGGNMRLDYKSRYSEDDAWESESDSRSDIFGSGTRVPVQLGEDGKLRLDFSDF